MNKRLDERLKALESRHVFEDLVNPGPDATRFERQAYNIRRFAQERGESMTQAEAERITQQFEDAIEEIDRLMCAGEAVN